MHEIFSRELLTRSSPPAWTIPGVAQPAAVGNTGAAGVYLESDSMYSLTGSMAAIKGVTMPNGAGGNLDTPQSSPGRR